MRTIEIPGAARLVVIEVDERMPADDLELIARYAGDAAKRLEQGDPVVLVLADDRIRVSWDSQEPGSGGRGDDAKAADPGADAPERR